MKKIVDIAVGLVLAGKRAYTRKWSFLGLFALAFFGGVILLGKLDLLPEYPLTSGAAAVVIATGARPDTAAAELPARIEIAKINLSASIANPATTNVEVLDQALLKGAVRYPTSAKLGETGNVVLFGHSSYLPIVGNQAYKTFNGIQKLVAGDAITIYSSGRAYTYTVRRMEKQSANDGGIELSVGGRVLTLSTCDSFGAKTDRFVVTADFVESHPASI